jgi:hypothetical protein
MLSHLSDKELLELASLLNRVLPLIIKSRSGEISAEERKELDEGVKNLLELLGVATPLGGKLAAYVAARKPGPVMRALGIADAVDTVLELVARMSQMIVRTELDSRILGGALTASPTISEGIDGGKAGFLCEALGRLWLREVQGGIWSNTRYEIIGAKDVDALAEEREGEILNLYVAEIKRTVEQDDVRKIEGTIDVLRKDYADARKSIEKTIKSVRIKTLWIIDFSKGPKPNIEEKLKKSLEKQIEREDEGKITFTYLDELKDSCRKAERVGRTLLKSIELLESAGVIGK